MIGSKIFLVKITSLKARYFILEYTLKMLKFCYYSLDLIRSYLILATIYLI